MKLKNILFVVRDIEKSKKFYKDLFELQAVTDFGDNVILLEGLVLQQQSPWERALEKKVIFGGNDAELYFEENNIDHFLSKLEHSEFKQNIITKEEVNDMGQRVIRLYDPDFHIIEVKEEKKWTDFVQNV